MTNLPQREDQDLTSSPVDATGPAASLTIPEPPFSLSIRTFRHVKWESHTMSSSHRNVGNWCCRGNDFHYAIKNVENITSTYSHGTVIPEASGIRWQRMENLGRMFRFQRSLQYDLIYKVVEWISAPYSTSTWTFDILQNSSRWSGSTLTLPTPRRKLRSLQSRL